jgi:hypothetical protein
MDMYTTQTNKKRFSRTTEKKEQHIALLEFKQGTLWCIQSLKKHSFDVPLSDPHVNALLVVYVAVLNLCDAVCMAK